jgi:hypothetical protein
MKNMQELTKVASQLAEDLLNGGIDVKTASEVNNTFGKIINAQKAILAYNVLKAQNLDMDTMEYLEDSRGRNTPLLNDSGKENQDAL